jgi:hypothetical protein
MSSPRTAHPTPAEERAARRADFARVLRRALDKHDVTQSQVADAVGIADSKVHRWCDHRAPEVPCAASIALMPRPVALDVLAWIGEAHHVHIVDELEAKDVGEHLSHLHTLIRETADATSAYAKALDDGVIDRAERRALLAELEQSISAQNALRRKLIADEESDVAAARPRIVSEGTR